MRLFLFSLLFAFSTSVGLAQEVPDLGPESDTPSLDDLGTLPETGEDTSAGKVVADGKQKETDELEVLFEQLAAAEAPKRAAGIARKIQAKWLESGSDTVDVLMNRAAVALQGKDYPLALDLLDVVVILKPDYPEGWNRRATVYYMQKDLGRSLTDIERTLALEPRHWGALSGLGIIQRRIGKEDEALKTFRRALEIHPGLENAREALEALEKAEEGEPV
jgi:tetratricopeptide (TPR) repeat protein